MAVQQLHWKATWFQRYFRHFIEMKAFPNISERNKNRVLSCKENMWIIHVHVADIIFLGVQVNLLNRIMRQYVTIQRNKFRWGPFRACHVSSQIPPTMEPKGLSFCVCVCCYCFMCVDYVSNCVGFIHSVGLVFVAIHACNCMHDTIYACFYASCRHACEYRYPKSTS